jgi:hypothetical protein
MRTIIKLRLIGLFTRIALPVAVSRSGFDGGSDQTQAGSLRDV